MFELLIRGGRIIDGTGQIWFRGSLGITGDTDVILRGYAWASSGEAARVIDAANYLVCPGFVDMPSRSDFMLLSDPKHEAKLCRGVTTEALGIEGLSDAPTTPANLEPLLTYLAPVNGLPPPDVRWSSVKEFLDLFDRRVSCNVAYFVPHAALWVEAMGREARLPTQAELARIRQLARKGMRDGTFGFATGLTYPPGHYSDTDEPVSICQGIGDLGGFWVTHARYSLGDRLMDLFLEAVDIGRRSGIPEQSSHYHSPVDCMGDLMVALVGEGQDSGVDVSFDQYPYPAASTLLHSLLPYWAHAGSI